MRFCRLFSSVSHIKTCLFLGDFTWIEVKTSKWTYSVYNVSDVFLYCVFYVYFFSNEHFFFPLKDSDGKYFVFPLASHRKSYSHVYCENSMLVRKYFFHVSSLFINLFDFNFGYVVILRQFNE